MKNFTPTFKNHLPAMHGHRIIISTIAFLIANFFFFSAAFSQSQSANPYTYTSDGAFVPAAGITSVYAEAWGGGGKGGNAHGIYDLGSGGGGGSYAASWVYVSPFVEYSAIVGLGGSGSHPDGGHSYFSTPWNHVLVWAEGGYHGSFYTGNGGDQGSGSIKHNGGHGANWLLTPAVWQSGGGGGGAGSNEAGGRGGTFGLWYGASPGSGGNAD
ncbi:MAG: hypothetical protein K8S16_01890, partial [Bacteroidales bacterium]|nr:hypothetical protein [Bacteroidales bacterium]